MKQNVVDLNHQFKRGTQYLNKGNFMTGNDVINKEKTTFN